MAYAIRRLEQEVQGLINQQQRPFHEGYYGLDDLDFLKKQFEKLNIMLGILQTSSQSIIEKGIKYEAWKQGSNVYRNIIEPLANNFFINKKLQNGLTRTRFAMNEDGTKYAIQGANTLCGDVYELVVIYRNGLAKNVIPNQGLETMWNTLCNTLSVVNNLGDSISTQNFSQSVTVGNTTLIVENGTIGGYKRFEMVLENYCGVMWKLCQSILNKISDIRIGGLGSVFGANETLAVHQCSLGPGVSLAPFNTCAEIFNTMQSPITVVSSCGTYPLNGYYSQLNYLTSAFNFSSTDCALVSLYTTWNPYVSDCHTLVGNGIKSDVSGNDLTTLLTAESNNLDPNNLTYCRAFGYSTPSVNRFDNQCNILTYQTNTSSGNYENWGINIQLYFNTITGTNNSRVAPEGTSGPSVFAAYGDNYGEVTGKIIINSTGFNFVGFYTNNTTNLSASNATLPATVSIGASSTATSPGNPSYQLYQLGGRIYYA